MLKMEELSQENEYEAESVSQDKGLPTLLVPKVQNMDNYLLKHYKSYIIDQLNLELVQGRIADLIQQPVTSKRILPEECSFQHFNYWRLNQTDFLIQIDLQIELQTQTTTGPDTDFYVFSVELWYSFAGNDEQCEYNSIVLSDNAPEYEHCWKLDKYLVPILRRDEIDTYSEEIWNHYDPAAANDGKLRNPRNLAQKIGLSIIQKKLYKRAETKAILFFQDGKIQIQPDRQPGQREDPPPLEIEIPAKAIVLNRHINSTYDYDLDIYHECIHYEWHYLFYQLQAMYVNNDLKQLKLVHRTSIQDQNYSSPIEFMEHQARYGSYGLMMPSTFMNETIKKMYQEVLKGKRRDENYDHDGRCYEVIARNIAGDYSLSKARVRARMIQLGYTAAKGALNYVDGRYITPFAFSEIEKATGNETYVIDRKAVGLLYKKDKEFQGLMRSGKFAFVDGHVVYRDSAGIRFTPDGARLSPWAYAHIDRVSLRFSKAYAGNHKYAYTFGQMNNDEALKNTFKFLDTNGSMTIQEAELAKTRLMEEMPVSFHGTLAYIMKKRVTVDELINRIPISRPTLMRLRTEERKKYNLDQIIAICIGLHLPPWLSEVLLDRAGLTVKRYGPYGYYGARPACRSHPLSPPPAS